ncbi:DUF3237 domain-containing protein [Jatrophihabitans fulvus]
MTAPELVPLARVSVAAGDMFTVDDGPYGNRVVAGISDGRWEGERFSGDIVGAGGDWAMPSRDGASMLLDVRQVVRTDDGATVYVTYHGRSDRARGTYTVAPTFETSDERYAWLNAVQAVGQGRFEDGRLNYEMFEVR